jgi:hypothetical protein
MLRSIILASVLCVSGLVLATDGAEAKGSCVKKAGQGWGITKDIAEFQSFEIIQQVTGNWPIQTDAITRPVYSCKGGVGDWTCVARATVCKKV